MSHPTSRPTKGSSTHRRRLRRIVADAAAVAVVVGSLVTWAISLRDVDVRGMTDLGLVSVLSPLTLASVVALSIGMVGLLRRGRPSVVLLATYVAALVVMLYALPVLVEETPRFGATWTHVGFTELIGRTGTVAPELDARFNWPGFFVLSAFIADVADVDVLAVATWSSVFFNMLYLLGLGVILRSLRVDWRLAWATAWVFELANWIGQDYYAPQALAYFIYLCVIGIVLGWLRIARPRSAELEALIGRIPGIRTRAKRVYGWLSRAEPPQPVSGPRQQAALLLAAVAMFSFVAFSHQLTPFFILSAATLLLLSNRTVTRSLPLVFGVIAIAWISFATVPFLSGHLEALLEDIGQLGQTLTANVASRVVGSPDHQRIVEWRILFTLALWGLAVVGAVLRARRGRRDVTTWLLAVAPAPLVALQAYGGELLLRVYLFSLPFVSLLVAGIVFGRPRRAPGLALSAVSLAGLALLTVSFFYTRYGNERADAMTAAERTVVESMYRIATPGSLLVAAFPNLPWQSQAVETFTYMRLEDDDLSEGAAAAAAAADRMISPRFPDAYLVLTRSQGTYAEVFLGLEPGRWAQFVAAVAASPRFEVIDQNADALLVRLRQATATP